MSDGNGVNLDSKRFFQVADDLEQLVIQCRQAFYERIMLRTQIEIMRKKATQMDSEEPREKLNEAELTELREEVKDLRKR